MIKNQFIVDVAIVMGSKRFFEFVTLFDNGAEFWKTFQIYGAIINRISKIS